MVKVYYSNIADFSIDLNSVFLSSKERRSYVETIFDEKRKKQSVLVWKLLEFALKEHGVSNSNFLVENGKWVVESGELYFSLSHSGNIISVAISSELVGVDVEKISEKCVHVGKKLFPFDKTIDLDEEEFFTIKWTEKESEFKRLTSGKFSSFKILDVNNSYILTVCANEITDSLEFVSLDKYINTKF